MEKGLSKRKENKPAKTEVGEGGSEKEGRK